MISMMVGDENARKLESAVGECLMHWCGIARVDGHDTTRIGRCMNQPDVVVGKGLYGGDLQHWSPFPNPDCGSPNYHAASGSGKRSFPFEKQVGRTDRLSFSSCNHTPLTRCMPGCTRRRVRGCMRWSGGLSQKRWHRCLAGSFFR